jgi:bifunctional non-homologous end joining protein LigD
VVLGVDGVAEFNVLHSRKHDHEVQLYAFDILALNGENCGACFRCARPTSRLFAWRPDGIFVAPFEKARSDPSYSAPPATWDLRAWCRSGLIARIAPDDRKTG